MTIAIFGAGAFGTALAIALSKDGHSISLWGRNDASLTEMRQTRRTCKRLPGYELPKTLRLHSDFTSLDAEVFLVAVPTQQLRLFLAHCPTRTGTFVACCKGFDRDTGHGPTDTIEEILPDGKAAILSGPSFAEDIAKGLPTALTVASRSESTTKALQDQLTRPALRLYRTTDVTGVEVGGGLKNVIAIAAGMTIGSGLGDSARASVISRGFAEIVRYATAIGAVSETLQGLSGLGDLVLTCTSEKSRNFRAGIALAKGDAMPSTTIEGIGTALAVAKQARDRNIDMPLTNAVADVCSGKLDISSAIATLLARPVGKE